MNMDLFGDLPEPNKKTATNVSLYDDLPNQSDSSNSNSVETTKRKHEADTVDSQNGSSKVDTKPTEETSKKKKTVRYKLTSYLAERQGERVDMQDAHLIITDYLAEFKHVDPSIYRMSVYGVFDGHGGVKASRFASQHLHKNLRDKFPKGDSAQVEKEIRKVFIEAFKKTDEDFLKEAAKYKPVWKDGTTAILILLLNDTMYIANIGDSQAVLCRYKEDPGACVPVALSSPHNPSVYEERMRIQKAGGHVKDGRVMGVLEVSRSFGDGQYKKLGVTCVPEIKKCQLTDNDRYVIVACDGLWKCFEPKDSIKFVNDVLQDTTIPVPDGKSTDAVRYDVACNKLASEAVLRLSADNVTVLLLAIDKFS